MSNTRQYEQGDIVDIHLNQDGVQFSFTVKLGALANGNISADMLTGDIEAVEQLVLDQQLQQSVPVTQSAIKDQLTLMEAELWARTYELTGGSNAIEKTNKVADAFRQRYLGDK